MKKRIIGIILFLMVIFITSGCEVKNSENKVNMKKNEMIEIKGIYVDESYENEKMDLVYVFLDISNGEKNIKISSNHGIELKVNDVNDYSVKYDKDLNPEYSDYYYSNVYKELFSKDNLKICMTFEVSKADLSEDKKITFTNSSELNFENIELKTTDIKRMSNIEKICEDLDKDIYTKKYEKKQYDLAIADEDTQKKVRKDIVGYYFTFYTSNGSKIMTNEVEFLSKNRVEVRATLSGYTLKRKGNYSIGNGYLIIKYDKVEDSSLIKDTGKPLYIKYEYENNEISLDNPFGSE